VTNDSVTLYAKERMLALAPMRERLDHSHSHPLMKRQRNCSADNSINKKESFAPGDFVYHRLVAECGPDDFFVLSFFAEALAYLALTPSPFVDDARGGASYFVGGTNRFFYRAYKEANARIVFPYLDARFATFAKDYDAWIPQVNPGTYGDDTVEFTPLCFERKAGNTSAVVAHLPLLHWLAFHRYPTGKGMPPETVARVADSLKNEYWISWLQDCVMVEEKARRSPFFGRPWQDHSIPTILCAAEAHSHRCLDGAVLALTAIQSLAGMEAQRELVSMWTFFGLMASLWTKHCTMHGSWHSMTSDMIVADKIKGAPFATVRGHFYSERIIFQGKDD
jgi:hypothetical protein